MIKRDRLEHKLPISFILVTISPDYISPQKYLGPQVNYRAHQDNRRRMKRRHSSGKNNYGR